MPVVATIYPTAFRFRIVRLWAVYVMEWLGSGSPFKSTYGLKLNWKLLRSMGLPRSQASCADGTTATEVITRALLWRHSLDRPRQIIANNCHCCQLVVTDWLGIPFPGIFCKGNEGSHAIYTFGKKERNFLLKVQKSHIARVRNCPENTMLNSLFGLCLFVFFRHLV